MPFLDVLFGRTVDKCKDFKSTGRLLPNWLQKQAQGLFEMETDLERGMATYEAGIREEQERYENGNRLCLWC